MKKIKLHWVQRLKTSFIQHQQDRLLEAVEKNDAQRARSALRWGANPNGLTYNLTLSSRAARIGATETLKVLIEHGADVFSYGNGPWLPIHHAALKGHLGALTVLIEQGHTPVDALTKASETPMEHLMSSPDENPSKNIPQQPWTALYLACRENRADAVTLLCQAGSDLTYTNEYGENLLIFCCRKRLPESAKALIDQHIDIHDHPEHGFNALGVCVQKHLPELCQILLNKGMDPMKPQSDPFETSPFFLAHQRQHMDLVALMEEHMLSQSLNHLPASTVAASDASRGKL